MLHMIACCVELVSLECLCYLVYFWSLHQAYYNLSQACDNESQEVIPMLHLKFRNHLEDSYS